MRAHRFLALDIGASKVVLAEFQIDRTGVPQLVNYGISPLGVEVEAETDPSAYIVATIRELMREHRIRPAPLGMTISGQAVFPRYVKLPAVARDKILQMIRYEAQQNVPFPINEVVWDYQLLGTEEEQLNAILVAVKTENVTKLTDCVLAVGLEPEIVDAAPMALYNCTRYNYPDIEGCVMVLDIGARSSNLVFVEGERVFSRSIPVAGNTITQEIMKEFELSFAEAEELKLKHGSVGLGGVYAGPENEVADRVSKVVRNVLTRLHAEVNRSTNFYRSQQGGNPPNFVLLAGGSSVMPHMDTFFQEKLKVPVEYLNPFVNVPVSPQADAERVSREIHLLGEVTGIALRRVLRCPIEVNLMPPNLVAARTFRRRQPFFALSAVGLILVMLCWWVYFGRMREMIRSLSSSLEEKTAMLKLKAEEVNAVTTKKAEVRAKVEELVGLIHTRTQWAEMLTAIKNCLLEGMWITAVRPVTEGDKITQIEISGKGFLDRLEDTAELTAVEQFSRRLAESGFFTSETKVIRMSPVTPEDYAREFTLRLVLAKPLSVQ